MPKASERHVEIVDLGRMGYQEALERQRASQAEMIDARGRPEGSLGTIFLVEHPPIITVTSRPSAAGNVLADAQRLEAAGVELHQTDRGGDVTYHGPGQIVAYPILDLERLGAGGKPLGLHGFMRLLEESVIQTLAHWGIEGRRDPSATGVWVPRPKPSPGPNGGEALAKIAAMGVRVRKWVTMHGLALNVDCDLSHFGLIVPCGLAGRPVTSMAELLGASCPSLDAVKSVLAQSLERQVLSAAR